MAESLGGTLKKEPVNRKVHPSRVHATRDVPSWTEPGHNPGRPPLSDRPPHTRRNRHRTQTPQSDSLNQTFTTVRETHFTPVSPAKECRWLGQLWSA